MQNTDGIRTQSRIKEALEPIRDGRVNIKQVRRQKQPITLTSANPENGATTPKWGQTTPQNKLLEKRTTNHSCKYLRYSVTDKIERGKFKFWEKQNTNEFTFTNFSVKKFYVSFLSTNHFQFSGEEMVVILVSESKKWENLALKNYEYRHTTAVENKKRTRKNAKTNRNRGHTDTGNLNSVRWGHTSRVTNLRNFLRTVTSNVWELSRPVAAINVLNTKLLN